LGFLVSCGSPPPLENTFSSPSELAAALLDALEGNDRLRLEQLAIDEREFHDHVWPRLPASSPNRNLPFSYVWGDLRQKSAATLSETLARHGGRRYRLIGVEFADLADYSSYRVHRDTALRVRDAEGGEKTLRLCGSMIESDGGWKVFSYVID
jgi:hypothetical protein